jgi:hypothetical protein
MNKAAIATVIALVVEATIIEKPPEFSGPRNVSGKQA